MTPRHLARRWRAPSRARQWIAAVLGPFVFVAGLWAAPAEADHIRVMTVRQIAGNAAPDNEITIRVEFEFSENCCGGSFVWFTGEVNPAQVRRGNVADGLVAGQYIGDQPPTVGNFVGGAGDQYTWSRYRPDAFANPNLVRIDITYTYALAGPYFIEWYDCCPTSGNFSLVVAGSPFEPKRILAPDTGNPSLDSAFALESIPPCDVLNDTLPLCYDKVNTLTMSVMGLDGYAAMVVGTEVNDLMLAALETRTDAIETWLNNGHGLAAYGQSALNGWDWLPTAGELLLTHPLGLGVNDVTVTPKGMLHMSHVNQLPETPIDEGSLADWGPSALNTFDAWPAYFDGAISGPLGDGLGSALAEKSSGRDAGAVVALGGPFPGGGCQVITGQPVDDKVSINNLPARMLFRSTIAYALSCTELGFNQD